MGPPLEQPSAYDLDQLVHERRPWGCQLTAFERVAAVPAVLIKLRYALYQDLLTNAPMSVVTSFSILSTYYLHGR